MRRGSWEPTGTGQLEGWSEPLAWAGMGSVALRFLPGNGKVQVSITGSQSWRGLAILH